MWGDLLYCTASKSVGIVHLNGFEQQVEPDRIPTAQYSYGYCLVLRVYECIHVFGSPGFTRWFFPNVSQDVATDRRSPRTFGLGTSFFIYYPSIPAYRFYY